MNTITNWSGKLLIIPLIAFFLASCNIKNNEPELILPTARYEELNSEHFSIEINFYDEKNRNSHKEKRFMTIIIHKYPDSPLEIPKYTIIPFQIEGTDIQGEAKLGALLTVTDPIIYSDKIQQLIKEEQPLNIVLEINENEQEVVGLIYRTPRIPSE